MFLHGLCVTCFGSYILLDCSHLAYFLGMTVACFAPTRHGCLKAVENDYCASKRGTFISSSRLFFLSPMHKIFSICCTLFYHIGGSIPCGFSCLVTSPKLLKTDECFAIFPINASNDLASLCYYLS